MRTCELGLVADAVADRKRCPDRPLRIVLVHDGRAEHRHDRVADELLDRAAVIARAPAADACVMRREQRAHVFRVELRSALAVEPTRSAKTTETTLRSSRRTAGANAEPHAAQNRASSRLSCPQCEHTTIRASVRRNPWKDWSRSPTPAVQPPGSTGTDPRSRTPRSAACARRTRAGHARSGDAGTGASRPSARSSRDRARS